MFSNIVDVFDSYMSKRERRALPELEWQPLVRKLQPHIETHSIFLETRHNGFVPLPSGSDSVASAEIVAVVVALVDEAIETWDTEGPARAMAEKLADVVGHPLPVMISREYRSFAGWYVRVAA